MEQTVMEQTSQQDPIDELDLVIGELEMDLPEAELEAKASTCLNFYCARLCRGVAPD